jgi:hypothetical protein
MSERTLSDTDISALTEAVMIQQQIFNPAVGFGETLKFAESLGWMDRCVTEGDDWTPELADALEEEALDFIRNAGWLIAELDEDT